MVQTCSKEQAVKTISSITNDNSVCAVCFQLLYLQSRTVKCFFQSDQMCRELQSLRGDSTGSCVTSALKTRTNQSFTHSQCFGNKCLIDITAASTSALHVNWDAVMDRLKTSAASSAVCLSSLRCC